MVSLQQLGQKAHRRQWLGPILLRRAKAAAHFAFQFVRHASRVPFSTQGSLPPFAGLGNQFVVL